MPQKTVVSAKIDAAQGADTPAPIADIPGWEVFKMEQTEVYEIRHNLGLSEPERDMHVTATSMTAGVAVVVSPLKENSFIVSAWGENQTPRQTDFMFIATYYETQE